MGQVSPFKHLRDWAGVDFFEALGRRYRYLTWPDCGAAHRRLPVVRLASSGTHRPLNS